MTTVAVTFAVRYQPVTSGLEFIGQTLNEAITEADTEAETLDHAEHRYRQGIELLRRSAREGGSTLPKAAKRLRQAAEEGHVRAQLMLGILHENGSGVIQDYEQALKWYRRAAVQGDAVAMYRVGSMLSKGIGADKNLIEAYAWCNIAAARGYQEAVTDRHRIANQLSAEEIKEAQQQSRTFDRELPHRLAAPFIVPAGL